MAVAQQRTQKLQVRGRTNWNWILLRKLAFLEHVAVFLYIFCRCILSFGDCEDDNRSKNWLESLEAETNFPSVLVEWLDANEETAEEDIPNKLKVQEGKVEVDVPRPWQGSSTLVSATSSSVLRWRSSSMNSTRREYEIHRFISSRHMPPFDPQLRFLLCKQ